ncbi:cell division and transport-associated protein TolR [Desulfosoma caldarium]|uniref:Cell division and transport-associated protein TolR n=2 Tax=Desulfosoma caldarium TaxID=610254 RepID=A0A3N1VHJ6_9BACT|nr:cell division and transport-associated protein TolR [Desulfosoma caldarium]
MKVQGPSRQLMSEINVTPFVDVMLVLLIIFMVTAPMMMQGVDVDLPNVEAPAIPSEEERLVVTVDAQRKVYINEYAVDMDTLGPKLSAIYRNKGGKQGVFLRADASLPYGFVMEVMGTIRQAGIDQIGMVTESGERRDKAPGG